MNPKRLIYEALNTAPGKAFRREIDRWMRANPLKKKIGDVTVVYGCATDIDVNRKAVTDGLGYDLDWVRNGPVAGLCDLGCNTGLFPLWIKNVIGVSPVGLAVDANPEMCERAWMHFALNDVKMVVRNGFVGESGRTPLRIHSISVASGAVQDPRQYGESVGVAYPPEINLQEAWQSAGDHPKDLLKVDIEGSELGLFTREAAFVSGFKRIAVEWHEPMCDLSTIRYLLNGDFRLDKYSVYGRIGLGYFVRR